jgi:hypothetical protein
VSDVGVKVLAVAIGEWDSGADVVANITDGMVSFGTSAAAINPLLDSSTIWTTAQIHIHASDE